MATSGLPLASSQGNLCPHTSLVDPAVSARSGRTSSRPFSMAFQPIVDIETNRTIAYEALVRGHHNEPASSILCPSRSNGRVSIDRACRLAAIEVASALGVIETGADLCINVNPRPAFSDIPNLPATIAAAHRSGLPLHRLILEVTEEERLRDPRQLQATLRVYRERGLRIAIDDFGAGFAGLSLLAAFHPDIIKIDIALTREIDKRPTSRVLVKSIAQICSDLDIQLIAEGVEELPGLRALQDLGVRYMQGHHFAAPAFEALPIWPN